MPGTCGPRHALIDAFWQHAHASALLHPQQHLLVAISGGADSVALLHLLRFTAPFELRITAAHFDHDMRPGSERDGAWVRGLCRAWGVALIEGKAASPLRGEAAARTARYRFLEQARRRARADAILTAHHLDDQAETLLFRIARGTGLTGLAGIPERRGHLLRPLLPFRRAILLSYACHARARWREDPTNALTSFTRNRIRALVMPALERAWPEAVVRLGELGRLSRGVENIWRSLLPKLLSQLRIERCQNGFSLARGVLLEYHPETRARVIRQLLRELGATPTRAGTRALLSFLERGASGTAVQLQGGIRVEREFDRILLRRPAVPGTGSADRPIRIRAPDDGRLEGQIGGLPVSVCWGGGDDCASGAHASFELSALRFPLVVRGWQPGDRITLGYGTKKVKKLLQERRVGRSARGRVVVLAEQEPGTRVLWIVDVARTAMVPERGESTWHIWVKHGEPG